MKKHILFIAMLCLVQLAAAQASSPNPWAGRLDLFHQDYLGEFSYGQLGVYDKVHIRPGVRLGIERSWLTGKRFRLYQDVMLGYYHNTYDERSWTLGTDLGLELRIVKQLRAALPIGIHYNNAKAIDVRYEYNGEMWVKAKNTDPAINRLQLQSGLNLGWRFLPESAHPVDAFATGSISLIGPWQPGSGIPVLIYKSVGLGLRVGI